MRLAFFIQRYDKTSELQQLCPVHPCQSFALRPLSFHVFNSEEKPNLITSFRIIYTRWSIMNQSTVYILRLNFSPRGTVYAKTGASQGFTPLPPSELNLSVDCPNVQFRGPTACTKRFMSCYHSIFCPREFTLSPNSKPLVPPPVLHHTTVMIGLLWDSKESLYSEEFILSRQIIEKPPICL